MPPLRIQLIVTGDMERRALAPSLRAQFPPVAPNGCAVDWLEPRKLSATTTHRLRAGQPPSSPMLGLAKAVVVEALRGATGQPADLVLAVDDLELHNVDQPDVVCDHFRRAVITALAQHTAGWLTGDQQAARNTVRARCSFHLLSPMVEAVLFGEHAALVRAGCHPAAVPQLRSTDWEDFWCTDPAFLPRCATENAKKAGPPQPMPWWREERHAKHYLDHLIDLNNGFYDETQQGARALVSLDWPSVPKAPADCPLVRAMFEDLADFFGVHSPLGPGTRSPHTYSGPPSPGSTQLLRNM